MRPGFELQNHTQARSTAASESAVRLQGDKRIPDVQASYSGRHSRGTGDLSQIWQRARTSKHQGSPLISTYTHSHTQSFHVLPSPLPQEPPSAPASDCLICRITQHYISLTSPATAYVRISFLPHNSLPCAFNKENTAMSTHGLL